MRVSAHDNGTGHGRAATDKGKPRRYSPVSNMTFVPGAVVELPLGSQFEYISPGNFLPSIWAQETLDAIALGRKVARHYVPEPPY